MFLIQLLEGTVYTTNTLGFDLRSHWLGDPILRRDLGVKNHCSRPSSTTRSCPAQATWYAVPLWELES